MNAAQVRMALGIPIQASRARGLLTLMFGNFLMWAGFFMVIPLITLRYVDGLGWSAASVGLALGTRAFTQQGLGVASGVLADRFGARGLILLGLLVRTLGFADLAWASDFPKLLLAMLLAGLGGALFDAPKSAAMAALSDPESRPRVYATLGVTSGIGMALGSLAGASLLKLGFEDVALVSGLMYLLTFVLSILLLPPLPVSENNGKSEHPLAGLGLVWNDSRFVTFTALCAGMFLMVSQFSLTLPLEAKRLAGTSDAVGWLYLVNTAVSIALQHPLTQLCNRFLRPIQAMLFGTLLMAVAFCAMAFSGDIAMLLLCVAVFAMGGAITNTQQQVIIANLAAPTARGAYFGFSALSFALGGGLGNTLGGALHDLGVRLALPALPWLLVAATGLLTACGMGVFDAISRRSDQTKV